MSGVRIIPEKRFCSWQIESMPTPVIAEVHHRVLTRVWVFAPPSVVIPQEIVNVIRGRYHE